jgi:hypothetical protein
VVRFGLETAFNDVLIEVLDHAEFRFQEGVFGFDYVDVLNGLHAFPDVEVIVRSYNRVPASVCSDFLSIFGLGLSDVGLGDEVIANVSLPVEYYLQYFVRNRFGRDLSAAEQEAIRPSPCEQIGCECHLTPRRRSDDFTTAIASSRLNAAFPNSGSSARRSRRTPPHGSSASMRFFPQPPINICGNYRTPETRAASQRKSVQSYFKGFLVLSDALRSLSNRLPRYSTQHRHFPRSRNRGRR